jgi:hypothetical protein
VESTQHSIAGAPFASRGSESVLLILQMPGRRRYGIRGWLAIVTLVTVSFASYGGMLYVFDTYVKGESGASALITRP